MCLLYLSVTNLSSLISIEANTVLLRTEPDGWLSQTYFDDMLAMEQSFARLNTVRYHLDVVSWKGYVESVYNPKSVVIGGDCVGIITGSQISCWSSQRYFEVIIKSGQHHHPLLGFCSKQVLGSRDTPSSSSIACIAQDAVTCVFFNGSCFELRQDYSTGVSMDNITSEASSNIVEGTHLRFLLSIDQRMIVVWVNSSEAARIDVSSLSVDLLEKMVPFFDITADCKLEISLANKATSELRITEESCSFESVCGGLTECENQTSFLSMMGRGYVLFEDIPAIPNFSDGFTIDIRVKPAWSTKEKGIYYSLLSYISPGPETMGGFSLFVSEDAGLLFVCPGAFSVLTPSNILNVDSWQQLVISYSKNLDVICFCVDDVEKYIFPTCEAVLPEIDGSDYRMAIGHNLCEVDIPSSATIQQWSGMVESVNIISKFRDSSTLPAHVDESDLFIPLNEASGSTVFLRSSLLHQMRRKSNISEEEKEGMSSSSSHRSVVRWGEIVGEVIWGNLIQEEVTKEIYRAFERRRTERRREFVEDVPFSDFSRLFTNNLMVRARNYCDNKNNNLSHLASIETSRVISPHVLNFLLIRYGLRQSLQLLQSEKHTPESSVLISTIVECLLGILEANFAFMSLNDITAASVGLKYAVKEESLPRSFVFNLFSSVYSYLSEANNTITDRHPNLVSCSIRTFMNGFHVFLPSILDQAYALEVILIVYFEERYGDVTRTPVRQNLPPEVNSVLSLYVGKKYSPPPSHPDVIHHFLATAKKVVPSLLHVLLEYFMTISRSETLFTSNVFPSINMSMSVSIGDSVKKGPHWRYQDQADGKNDIGKIVDVSDWGYMKNSCVHVQWKEEGPIHCYRYGVEVIDTTGTKKVIYDVIPEKTTERGEEDTLSDEAKTIQLLYTPAEVRNSLVEDIGELMKRDVLKYMKQVSTQAWQVQYKLNWTENTLVKKLSGEDIASIYENFYETFGNPTNVQGNQHPDNSRTICTGYEHSNALHVIISILLRLSCNEGSDLVAKSARKLLLLLQALSMGLIQSRKHEDQNLCLLQEEPALESASIILSDAKYEWNFTMNSWGPRIADSTHKKEVKGTEIFREPALAASSQPVRSRRHSHDLKLTSRDRNLRARCDLCNGVGSCQYHCAGCDWDICSECFRSEEQPMTHTLNSSKKSSCLMLLDACTAIHLADNEWGTCMGKEKLMPYTGVYIWKVIFGESDKGFASFLTGVCTENCTLNRFVGATEKSWGLAGSGVIYHNNVPYGQLFVDKIVIGEEIIVKFDSNDGVLSFCRPKHTESCFKEAFRSLAGMTLFPASSLCTRAQTFSILRVGEKSTEVHARMETLPPVMKLNSSFLRFYASAMVELCTDAFHVPSTSSNDFFFRLWSMFVASMSSLQTMKGMSLFSDRLLSDLCLRVLEGAIKFSKNLNQSMKCGVTSRKCCDVNYFDLLMQTTAVLYGRLVMHQIKGCSVGVDNFLYNHELQTSIDADEITRSKIEYNLTPLNDLIGTIAENKAFPILSSGLMNAEEVDKMGGLISTSCRVEEASSVSSRIVEWLTNHDSTNIHVKQLGGTSLTQLVRSLFVNILHHAGYSGELQKVVTALDDNDNSVIERKPSFILSYAWNISESFRSWVMREKQLHGVAYEILAQRYFNRIHFLLGVSKLQESFIDTISTASQAKIKAELDETKSRILYFAQDKTPLFLFRAAMKVAEMRAVHRTNGFKSLTSFMHKCTDQFWMLKYTAVCSLPFVMRTESSNPHYLIQDPILSSNNVRLSCRAAFEIFYRLLLDELSECCRTGNTVSTIHLLSCWGLRICNRDHDFISRIDLFYTLRDVVGASLDNAFESEVENNLVLRVAMKVLFILAEQVASATDQAPAHLPDNAPPMQRSRSGPETLSDVALDILYGQLETIVIEYDGNKAISSDSSIFISETLDLMGKLCKNSSCLKILLKPRWVALFIRIGYGFVNDFTYKSFYLLSVLLPLANIDDDSSKSAELTEFIEGYKQSNVGVAHVKSRRRVICDALFTLCDQFTLPLHGIFIITSSDESSSEITDAGTSVQQSILCSSIFLMRLLSNEPAWTEAVTDTIKCNLLSSHCHPDENLEPLNKMITALQILSSPCSFEDSENPDFGKYSALNTPRSFCITPEMSETLLCACDFLIGEDSGKYSKGVPTSSTLAGNDRDHTSTIQLNIIQNIYDLALVASSRTILHLIVDEDRGRKMFLMMIEEKFTTVNTSKFLCGLFSRSLKPVKMGNVSAIPLLEEHLEVLMEVRNEKRKLSIFGHFDEKADKRPILNRAGVCMSLGTDSNKDK